MEQEQLTLYKLMILYLIEKVDFPLSNSQISEFILDKGYTNYFTVQRAFHELEEENMLRVKQIRNMSHYALSDEGSEAIEMFEYQIPNSIKEDIAQFLKEKEEINVEEFVQNNIIDKDLKESFKEHMEDKGLIENFSVDKKWVEKKLKKRSIKTDTGFDIKGNLSDFEDAMKYSVRKNENGTFDIVIKNVSFYEEK